MNCLRIFLITVSIHVSYHYLKLLKKLKHTFLLCPLKILLLIVILKMKRQLTLKLKLIEKVKNRQVFLCVLALASVIKRNIFSHFPDCGDEMQRVLRNQVICPRAECLSEVPVHVLFCKLGGQRLHKKRIFFKLIILSH